MQIFQHKRVIFAFRSSKCEQTFICEAMKHFVHTCDARMDLAEPRCRWDHEYSCTSLYPTQGMPQYVHPRAETVPVTSCCFSFTFNAVPSNYSINYLPLN